MWGEMVKPRAFNSAQVSFSNPGLIDPDARTQAASPIRLAHGERSLAELARSLETSWLSAQRLGNPRHSPTLRQLEKAAAALGKRLVLALE